MGVQESTAVGQGYRQETTGERVIDRLAAVERQLWWLLAAALLADLLTTYAGLQAGLAEGNPAMRAAIDAAGVAALLGVKLAVVGVGAGLRRVLDERGAVVPLGLALPWLVAAAVNATLLF
jgi:uncharacterized membrane protein